MSGRRKNQESVVSLSVLKQEERSVSNAVDDNEELTLTTGRLLVIFTSAVLWEWWDNFS